MAAHFVVGRDQHVLAVLDAFDLALHDSQLGWIPLIVGGVDGEEPSLDALQLGHWIVVAGSRVLIQQVVSVSRRWSRQTLAQMLGDQPVLRAYHIVVVVLRKARAETIGRLGRFSGTDGVR